MDLPVSAVLVEQDLLEEEEEAAAVAVPLTHTPPAAEEVAGADHTLPVVQVV